MHNIQPFKTFDLTNFDIRPDPKEGFFFKYDKLYWSFTGEVAPVGQPQANPQPVSSDDNPAFNPNSPPTPILNNILNGPPDATFGYGNRYEFGYVVDHHGWHFSVLDAPDVLHREVYGFGTRPVNTFPVPTGSVQINFNIPPEFTGLLDGPIDLDNDGVLDNIITFIVTFDQVTVQNRTETQGVEVMKTYRFDPTHNGSLIEFHYGARYLRLRDQHRVDTVGSPIVALQSGPIGRSFWDTRIDNQMVGPQVGLNYSNQRGRWNFGVSGRGMLGVNVQNLSQDGSFGEALNPMALNHPAYFNPTSFASKRQEQDFSPLVEMRVSASYQLTQAISLHAGWNAIFVDNIRRAALHVDYTLPNFGIRDAGTQEIFINGLNFGIEVNH